jgi:hypothetical protein
MNTYTRFFQPWIFISAQSVKKPNRNVIPAKNISIEFMGSPFAISTSPD